MIRKSCLSCGQPLPEYRLGIHLTPMQAIIFDIVSCDGGISIDDTLDRAKCFKSEIRRKTVHVYVSKINDLLDGTGYKIKKFSLGKTGKGTGNRRNVSPWIYYLEKPRKVGSGR